ncbi:MAG: hypothetical protein IPP73_01720 [Chitinophagaceae bacterium]|nr:hypothetical protein [Chitinophagaceae bacterium]
MRFAFLIALTMMVTTLQAQTGLTEITKTDITKLASFDGRKISFFGLHAGMTKQEAMDLLRAQPKLVWEYDDFNTRSKDPKSTDEMRIYVNMIDDTNGEKKLELAYIVWSPGTLQMTSMVIYNDAARFMQGDTKKLFTLAALKPGNSFTGFLKSSPVKKAGIATTYTYETEHFAFIHYSPSGEEGKVYVKFLN